MEEVLLLFIGAGQGNLDSLLEQKYRQACYFLDGTLNPNNLSAPANPSMEELTKWVGQTDGVILTPFVGEALLTLLPDKFSHVHILGTREAMWSTLYFYCASKNSEDEAAAQAKAEELYEPSTISSNTLIPIAESFTQMTGVPTTVHLIETNPTIENLWHMLNLIIKELNLTGKSISIDITHSLRYHPILMYLSLNYLDAFAHISSINSIFYAALELGQNRIELTGDKKESITIAPIYDLRLLSELMRWIDAAKEFSQHGTAERLLSLLDDENHNALKKHLKEFSDSIQFNLLGNIKNLATDLLGDLQKLKISKNPSLRLIADQLAILPRTIAYKEQIWEGLLELAEFHYLHRRMGLACLSLLEAVTYRMVVASNQKLLENHRQVQKLLRPLKSAPRRLKEKIENILGNDVIFLEYYENLVKIRNATAHYKKIEMNELEHIGDYLATFKSVLPKGHFEQIVECAREYYSN